MSRGEAVRLALGEVYAGAGQLEASALLDHLHDLGFEVVRMPAARAKTTRRVPHPVRNTG